MQIGKVRFDAFERMLVPVSTIARRKRMKAFLHRMRLRPHAKILDLGGQPVSWTGVEIPLDITILNLPGVAEHDIDLPHHRVRFVEGDACDIRAFSRGEFDLVYSNSVIEHVGPEHRQDSFAAEVKRLSARYWVQTPSKWFPFEAHCGMPLWWFYPEPVRRGMIERWRAKLPEWTEMVDGTRVLTLERLKGLFPGASVYTEWMLGFPKSHTMYSVG